MRKILKHFPIDLFSVLGVNDGVRTAFKIREANPVRVFHVTGKFGKTKETNFRGSRTVAEATFSHIYQDKLAVFLAAMQASHQKKMFDMLGVDLQSQTAYDIASRGLIRPIKRDVPMVYGIKCIEFNRPLFVVEIVAVNETEEYLCSLIEEIGIQMHSLAYCRKIRCARFGPFDAQQSLLREYWRLQDSLDNMSQCREIVKENLHLLKADTPELHLFNKT